MCAHSTVTDRECNWECKWKTFTMEEKLWDIEALFPSFKASDILDNGDAVC
jgi:hypothetical protein